MGWPGFSLANAGSGCTASGVPAVPVVVTGIVEVIAEVVTEVVVTATPAPIMPTPMPILTPTQTLMPTRTPALGEFYVNYNLDRRQWIPWPALTPYTWLGW